MGNYLALVKGTATGVASTIDADFAAIITAAKTALAGLPDGKGGARSRDPKDVVKRNLKEALVGPSPSTLRPPLIITF